MESCLPGQGPAAGFRRDTDCPGLRVREVCQPKGGQTQTSARPRVERSKRGAADLLGMIAASFFGRADSPSPSFSTGWFRIASVSWMALVVGSLARNGRRHFARRAQTPLRLTPFKMIPATAGSRP